MHGVPLSLDHRERIAAWIEGVAGGWGEQRLSEHSFANLYLFRQAHAYRLAESPLPAIVGKTYDGTPHLMPLCLLDDTAAAGLLSQAPPGACLYPIASWQTEALDARRFAWTDSAADADYLYPAQQFVSYRGQRLQKKRNQMRQLLARHTVKTEPLDPVQAEAVLAGWMRDKGHASGGADETSCREALGLARRLGLLGYLYLVDGRPGGFLIAESLGPGVFVVRFAKGLDCFGGLYPFMFHHFASCHPGPVQWLNFEQDLGLDNFRRTKRALQPSALLRKFRVTLRQPSG